MPTISLTLKETRTIRIGIISDTHVPDRVGALHPEVVKRFSSLNLDLIIHAGDASGHGVIAKLEEIAPVVHAAGNRDFLMSQRGAASVKIKVNDVIIGIAHGHGGWLRYLWDKSPTLVLGYRFERYKGLLDRYFNSAKVIVFGHTHTAENRWENDKLYFNSGSAYDRGKDKTGPSIGLITISENGEVESEIIKLAYYRWIRGKWVKSPKKKHFNQNNS